MLLEQQTLFFGLPIHLDKNTTLYQPTLNEILDKLNIIPNINAIKTGFKNTFLICMLCLSPDTRYVPKVYINFRKPDEKALDVITVAEAKQYLEEGHFAEGSMAPKIRAGIMFVENGGKECVITEAGQLGNASCGTRIVK